MMQATNIDNKESVILPVEKDHTANNVEEKEVMDTTDLKTAGEVTANNPSTKIVPIAQ